MDKIYNKLGIEMLKVSRKTMEEKPKGYTGISIHYCVIDDEVVVWPKEEDD